MDDLIALVSFVILCSRVSLVIPFVWLINYSTKNLIYYLCWHNHMEQHFSKTRDAPLKLHSSK